jgi:hypothetical protein
LVGDGASCSGWAPLSQSKQNINFCFLSLGLLTLPLDGLSSMEMDASVLLGWLVVVFYLPPSSSLIAFLAGIFVPFFPLEACSELFVQVPMDEGN